MSKRGLINPAPKTDSARSAAATFHCDLCNKSYSRQPEFESHILSYDHQHQKRLKDLKQLSRDPNAVERARKAEKKADAEAGLMVVDEGGGGGGVEKSTKKSTGGFKKGGFKSSFITVNGGEGGGPNAAAPKVKAKNVFGEEPEKEPENRGGADADSENEYAARNDYYDPRRPTGCSSGCPAPVLSMP